eukprot:CAMPEP_0119372652 /NCGR_PEP_ID=MMETSP1334-20130426/20968_1 /TAXON_ID=127549 /ORGANISM="Calcidiscus leptoporus, Strain RCC1130" /LENGTH=170 /DNA_ID=CAMNT_0007390193 /DNA_START=167 /DNA_END=680 /DNA_ORIENTATION=+
MANGGTAHAFVRSTHFPLSPFPFALIGHGQKQHMARTRQRHAHILNGAGRDMIKSRLSKGEREAKLRRAPSSGPLGSAASLRLRSQHRGDARHKLVKRTDGLCIARPFHWRRHRQVARRAVELEHWLICRGVVRDRRRALSSTPPPVLPAQIAECDRAAKEEQQLNADEE